MMLMSGYRMSSSHGGWCSIFGIGLIRVMEIGRKGIMRA